jgi:pyrroline-5-carboxylate reductase
MIFTGRSVFIVPFLSLSQSIYYEKNHIALKASETFYKYIMLGNKMELLFSEQAPLVLVGCGNMGSALLKGWLDAGLSPDAVYIIDPTLAESAERPSVFRQIKLKNIVAEAVSLPVGLKARTIVVAIKPQMMSVVLPTLIPIIEDITILVSVAAGTTIANFEAYLGSGVKVIRTMPNTPAAVGAGMTGLVAKDNVGAIERKIAETLMEATGETVWVEREELINVVTAVSGSGPAYVFHMIECLSAAAENEGLPKNVAEKLARQTIVGAGALLSAEPETNVFTFRERVTSPKGTTAAGLDALMGVECGLGGVIRETVRAARKRSEELSD